jgi:hypothetical protein
LSFSPPKIIAKMSAPAQSIRQLQIDELMKKLALVHAQEKQLSNQLRALIYQSVKR